MILIWLLKQQEQAFDSGKWTGIPANEKGKIIWKIGDLIDNHAEELAQLESLDNGKPVAVAGAADVPLSSDIFRYMAGWATKIEGETIPISVPYTPGAQYHSYTVKEPVGVVGQIIPMEFPTSNGCMEDCTRFSSWVYNCSKTC